jgi:subtilisin family serine protease
MDLETRRRSVARKPTVESLEDRRVMSADPLSELLGGSMQHHAIAEPEEQTADFWIDLNQGFDLDQHLNQVEQHLAQAHEQTGLTQVRNDYGFIGMGQTVAIIDSGIAYSHYALGGGFGSNYRVVGGWDFTENDANPYDDGPYGSHGTHVSGIVGADGGTSARTGVAPGVDFVGLRVFDDAGAGYFSWVENALRWVHQNRNAYENPITAINLSLGTSWNSSTVPSWAMLEDEFAQLEADGIFIAVSAGNSFQSYGTTGLSYPAASSYVVPVMATNDSGNLAYFSQRHSRAIAAPGQYIVSTVPDYAGNHNGSVDDWASYSGTSMASPYVAGASVLIREAMQFVGYSNITQDTIYDHMRATADSFYDSATSQYYKRLNLESAIDALMPSDDYGSSVASAFNLGALFGSEEISGLIGKLSDSDYFRFTAGTDGTITLTADTTHTLRASWNLNNGAGVVSGPNGSVFTFDVVAGQSYVIGLATSGGIGYYDLDINFENSIDFTDWGDVRYDEHSNVSNSGEAWYRLTATRTGYFTALATFNGAAGNVDLVLYNSNMQQVGTRVAGLNSERINVMGSNGAQFYLCVQGDNADIDFQFVNLVTRTGSTVTVTGTPQADTLSFAAGSTHTVSINGVSYDFSSSSVNRFYLNGRDGQDVVTLTGTSGNETASIRTTTSVLVGSNFRVTATGVKNGHVDGNGGYDTVSFYDSTRDDSLSAWSDHIVFSGTGFQNEATDFDRTFVRSRFGNDTAHLYDSSGNDTYSTWRNRAAMYGDGFFNDTRDFAVTYGHAGDGNDRAFFRDSSGNDTYTAWCDRVILEGNSYRNEGNNFDQTTAFASSGYDEAFFYYSLGDETYEINSNRAMLYGEGFYNEARDFDVTSGDSMEGSGASSFGALAINENTALRDNWFEGASRGFTQALAYASPRSSVVTVREAAPNDTVLATNWGTPNSADQSDNDAQEFARAWASQEDGNDETAEVTAVDYLFETEDSLA